jgi:hypothetical protein
LPRKDYGDQATTLLLNALEVGLEYRFMFLEEKSQFSPTLFGFTDLKDLKARASEMKDRLTLLVQTADEKKLRDPKNIIDILGVKASGDMDNMYKKWDHERNMLDNATKRILTQKEIAKPDKDEFVGVISSFCEHTREMNQSYTAAVLNKLLKIVSGVSGTETAPKEAGRTRMTAEPNSPKASPATNAVAAPQQTRAGAKRKRIRV